jgi:hypothetical protein
LDSREVVCKSIASELYFGIQLLSKDNRRSRTMEWWKVYESDLKFFESINSEEDAKFGFECQ